MQNGGVDMKAYFKKNNSGFTLVELIVVIMILAILASISVPLFMHYFDTEYDEEIHDDATDVLNAAQSVFYEMYAENSHNPDYTCIIDGVESTNENNANPYRFHGKNNGIKVINGINTDTSKYDCDLHKNTGVTSKINNLLNFDLYSNSFCKYCILVLGRSDIYADPLSEYYDPVKAYTVYYIIFQPKDNYKVTFLTKNGSQYNKNPVTIGGIGKKGDYIYVNGLKKSVDWIMVDDEKIYIQYYGIKIKLDNNGIMKTTIWDDLKKEYN